MTLYFAYGANMVAAAMATRCPGARLIGPARLAHHRFTVIRSGHGTVLPRKGAAVHGLLWRLKRGNEAALDRYEEVAAGLYRRERRVVFCRGRAVPALLYVAAPTASGRARPRYLAQIIAVAREFGFPEPYIASLETIACTSAGVTPASRSARRLGAPARLA